MRDWTKVSALIWRSKVFTALSDDQKLLYIYLLTNCHQNACGCFVLPTGYGTSDLGWPSDKYMTALGALIEANMIMNDPATDEILIMKWFKHNAPQNPSTRTSVIRAIEKIQSDRLRVMAQEGLTASEQESQDRKEARAAMATNSGAALLTTPHMRRVK
jgi:hypothetical protein